jgi:hypothetical protein
MKEKSEVVPRSVIEWLNHILGRKFEGGIAYSTRELALGSLVEGDVMLFVCNVYIVLKQEARKTVVVDASKRGFVWGGYEWPME